MFRALFVCAALVSTVAFAQDDDDLPALPTAAGNTAGEATNGAHTTACGPIASGMNETIACGNTAPALVECKKR